LYQKKYNKKNRYSARILFNYKLGLKHKAHYTLTSVSNMAYKLQAAGHNMQLVLFISRGGSRGGFLGSGDPPPKHIREAKGMMCCYKNT